MKSSLGRPPPLSLHQETLSCLQAPWWRRGQAGEAKFTGPEFPGALLFLMVSEKLYAKSLTRYAGLTRVHL